MAKVSIENMFRVTILLGLSLVFLFGTGQSGGELPGRRLLSEAQLLLDSARYDEALQQVQRALASFPDRAPETGECLLLLGNVFLEKGEWDAAGQQYNAALSIFLKKPGPKHLRGKQVFWARFFQKGKLRTSRNPIPKSPRHSQSRRGAGACPGGGFV